MAERAERLIGETSLLAGDFALKRAIATYDPDTLSSVAVNYRERIGVDLLWITDENGRLLAGAGGQRRARPRARPSLAPLAAGDGDRRARRRGHRGRRRPRAARRRAGVRRPIRSATCSPARRSTTRPRGSCRTSTGPAVSFLTARASLRLVVAEPRAPAALPATATSRRRCAPTSPRARQATGDERSTFLRRSAAASACCRSSFRSRRSCPSRSSRWCRSRTTTRSARSRRCGAGSAAIGAAALLGALLVGGMIAGGIAAPVQLLVARHAPRARPATSASA